jgi:hypothetical protein
MNAYTNRSTLMALLLAIPGLALAAPEVETNHPIASAQALEMTFEQGAPTGGAAVAAIVGNPSGALDDDLDFFTFSGREGDVVTLDIDNGAGDGAGKSVDTIMAIFGPGTTTAVLRQNDDMTGSTPIDPGSKSRLDAHISNFRLPATGTYTVGVSSFPRDFLAGGTVKCRSTSCKVANGDYTLLITGVSPSVQQINIDIKPGSGDVAPINPKARGKVPVALLGSSEFPVEDVDVGTLTFGHGGDEESLSKCGSPGDLNGDAFPDLVCHFENQTAQFASSDTEAVLRGSLDNGGKFEGRGWLKVVPVKAAD